MVWFTDHSIADEWEEEMVGITRGDVNTSKDGWIDNPVRIVEKSRNHKRKGREGKTGDKNAGTWTQIGLRKCEMTDTNNIMDWNEEW
jgi:hypothetical protein